MKLLSNFLFLLLFLPMACLGQENSSIITSCEPIADAKYQPSFMEVNSESKKGRLYSWLRSKVGKTVQSLNAKVQTAKYKVQQYTKKLLWKGATHPVLARTIFANTLDEKKGMGLGFWALMTFLGSLLFLAILPSFGFLALIASIVMAIIGTVRDRDGLSILVLVLGFFTLLLLLIIALFQSLFVVFLLGG
jgi:hypothetical protein